jgi:hypothetical protein
MGRRKKATRKKPVKCPKKKTAPKGGPIGLRDNTEYLAFHDGGLQTTYFWRGPRPY